MGRTPTWLGLILLCIGLLLLIPALWVFSSITATPEYPNAESVPAVGHSAPLPEWAGAADQARQIVRASVAEQNLPGLSVAVGVNGSVVWAEGFGFADVRTSTRVTPNHRFRIGTASTVLTSAAVGVLIEEGRLKLDQEIQTYVPEFPQKQWPVTLRELMGHTAGVIPDGGGEGPHHFAHCERPVDALQYFPEESLQFEPGTEYRYSSFGWVLVSAAVEAAAGQPFLTFLRERIFEPLGMRHTAADPRPDPAVIEGEDPPIATLVRELIYDPDATRDPDATNKPSQDGVTPYFPRFLSDPNYGMHVMRPRDYSCYAGASVFVSTPSDLVRFGMAINNGTLLEPATAALLQTPHWLRSGEEAVYGLGWYLKSVTLAGKQTSVIGQDGNSMGGMVASLMIFPDSGMVVAVTSNISHADTSAIAMEVAEAFQQPAPR